jgi:light-regulated signal transduction histidine kinase (bacteriophytochrome)
MDDALEPLRNLRLAIEENNAIILRQPLPHVKGDCRQLAQVFQNLIGNSLMYRSERAPEIRVSVKREADHWVFSVADSGIGFDRAYGERIFGIFKRLHHDSQIPGTGIGLSISRKIIEQHGGRMWYAARQGAGATFYFSLPVTQPNSQPSLAMPQKSVI